MRACALYAIALAALNRSYNTPHHASVDSERGTGNSGGSFAAEEYHQVRHCADERAVRTRIEREQPERGLREAEAAGLKIEDRMIAEDVRV
jgi:hypothetical protein